MADRTPAARRERVLMTQKLDGKDVVIDVPASAVPSRERGGWKVTKESSAPVKRAQENTPAKEN